MRSVERRGRSPHRRELPSRALRPRIEDEVSRNYFRDGRCGAFGDGGRTGATGTRAESGSKRNADIRQDRDGKPCFIEVNPLAGIRPGYSDLCFIADFRKLSYQQLIGKFLDAFLARQPR